MTTVIWRIHDAKPGHANQTRGLVRALAALTEVKTFDIPTPSKGLSWRWWLTGKFSLAENLPKPDLILGAGHATHVAVLAARRAYGGKAIVLMKPSLPLRFFDLCVVPEHDAVAAASNLVSTRGVLNVVEPSNAKQSSRGLMLIGGPSSACDWNNEEMIAQIVAAASAQPAIQWTLTTSRRTPAEFVGLLGKHRLPNLAVVPCEQTGPGWVPQELARSNQVWVSEDSVSMVYEALTSGAAIGLFSVPSKRAGRVARGVDALVRERWVTRFAQWNRREPLPLPPGKLHEAERCASLICDRYQLSRAA